MSQDMSDTSPPRRADQTAVGAACACIWAALALYSSESLRRPSN
ncbi:MAG TPA: hypothetical protein VEB64_12485 [Azospirillaceae bacterium]|nr:hypothetical protein [Azospirillaceae bacterium]